MTFLGIAIILTGTAMCVAGWYLGHFDSETQLVPVSASSNLTASDSEVVGEGLQLLGMGSGAEIPPARGLAYAGPVVMSFGCFAVVFACVVVCETRDRVLETMDDRVRRGLPARPPGGIEADFYSLVVECRRRHVERQRRRRKQLLRAPDEDDEHQRTGVEHHQQKGVKDYHVGDFHHLSKQNQQHVRESDDHHVGMSDRQKEVKEQRTGVDYAAAGDVAGSPPPQPTLPTADVQSPSTINDFVEDRDNEEHRHCQLMTAAPDQRVATAVEQRLPTVRLERLEDVTDVVAAAPCSGVVEKLTPTPSCSNLTFPDNKSKDVELKSQNPCTDNGRRSGGVVRNLSLSWKPNTTTTNKTKTSSRAQSSPSRSLSLYFDNDVFVGSPSSESASAPASEQHRQRLSIVTVTTASSSQLSFPLLAPITSMTQISTFPYVRLDVASVSQPTAASPLSTASAFSTEFPPPFSSVGPEVCSTQPTYLVHTASVHAIADRSPDVVAPKSTTESTSFKFPPPPEHRLCHVVTSSGAAAVVSDDVTVCAFGAVAAAKCDCPGETLIVDDSASGSKNFVNKDDSNVSVCDNVSGSDLKLPDDVAPRSADQVDGEVLRSAAAAALDLVPASPEVANPQCKRLQHIQGLVDHRHSVADSLTAASSVVDNCPTLSDDGPSRKRSRGGGGGGGASSHPSRQVLRSPVHDNSASPLPRPSLSVLPGAEPPQPYSHDAVMQEDCMPQPSMTSRASSSSPVRSSYLISQGCGSVDHAAAVDAFGGTQPLYRDAGVVRWPQRRRLNGGIGHLLTTVHHQVQRHRRRSNTDQRREFSSAATTTDAAATLPRRLNFVNADDGCLTEAHHRAGNNAAEHGVNVTQELEAVSRSSPKPSLIRRNLYEAD